MFRIKYSVFIYLLILIGMFISFSCKKKTNNIKIPSYIAVDTIKLLTNPETQGSSKHAISDCWLFVNGDTIGIFEVPFKVPVLANGNSKISIHGGIKKSASDTKRIIYPFIEVFNIEMVLTEGQVTTITPVFKYRPVNFIINEDFDGTGILFEKTEQSDTEIQIVPSSDPSEGMSLFASTDNTNPKFECISSDEYILPKNNTVFLEVSFKSNDLFDFGFFVLEPSQGDLAWVRKSIFTFNDSKDVWKTVFIDLDHAINNTKGNRFKLYFRSFHSKENTNEKTNIYLDNIKLISYKLGNV